LATFLSPIPFPLAGTFYLWGTPLLPTKP